MIYEGTNEIQAIDLVQRKVLDRPQRLEALIGVWAEECNALQAKARECAPSDESHLLGWSTILRDQIAVVGSATEALRRAAAQDPEYPFKVADDCLLGLGLGLFAWAWARLARAAVSDPDPVRRARMLNLASHGRTWLLPQARIHWDLVATGTLVLAELPARPS